MQVELEISGCMENLVAFRVRLQSTVLDAVVNHFHVVTRAWRAHMRIPVRWSKSLEDRFAKLKGFG